MVFQDAELFNRTELFRYYGIIYHIKEKCNIHIGV